MSWFKNPFGVGKESSEGENKTENQETLPEAEERKVKKIYQVKIAKQELEALQSERKEKIKEYREKKDEIKELGVAEFEDEFRPVKRTETFNDLISSTEKDLQEISEKIGQIREEFDLTPSYVKILEERRERVRGYIENIRQKMAPEYRAVESKINNFFGENPPSRNFTDGERVRIFLESLQKDNADLPEVKEFTDKFSGVSLYENEGVGFAEKEINDFRKIIKETITEKTEFKTKGEINEAYEEINRGISLDDRISKILTDAKNKEGDFKNQKGYF